MNWFAKKEFDGGGVKPKNRCKSCSYLSKIFNLVKIRKILSEKTSKPLDRCIEKNTARSGSLPSRCPSVGASCRGSILIEFALCMPVLIILLFYIHDLIKIKRWYSQTEFVAQQAANMIQNISQKRGASDPTKLKITKSDLQHIFTLATLTIYPDNNFCSIPRGHKHGHFGEIFLYYVKGNDNGTADVLWGYKIQTYRNGLNPSAIGVGPREASNDRSHVKILTGVPPQEIWPTLKIGPNDKKIILEFCIDYSNISQYKLGNGDGCDTVSPSQIFGLNLIKPKGTVREATLDYAYFNSVVIFSPKPGLFDPDNPPTDS